MLTYEDMRFMLNLRPGFRAGMPEVRRGNVPSGGNAEDERGNRKQAIRHIWRRIAAVVLGGTSLFLPFFAAVFLVPTALVCSLVALKNKSHGLGMVGLILSGLGAIGIFSVSSGVSAGLGTHPRPQLIASLIN